MKKVLMLASEASHFTNFHIPYMRHMLSKGDSVYTASNGDFSFNVGKNSVIHKTLGFRKKMTDPINLVTIFKLAALIRKENFDTVYTNSTLAGFMGRMALKLSGKRKTRSVHICHGYLFSDDKSRRSKKYLFFEKVMRKRTDVLAVMNKEDLDIAEKYSLGKKIVYINGMGVNTSKFTDISQEDIQSERKKLGGDENTLMFLCAGEFSARKSQSTVIKASSLMKHRNFRIIFAGDGALLEECKLMTKRLGVEDRTVFLGHTENMNLLYRSCDCLISASRYEGLPFNVMEALYCGEKIVVSDVKGNRDLAEECGGALFPFDNYRALAEILDKTETDKERSCKLAKKYYLKNVLNENITRLML